MTSNQHGPYVRGHTRVTMARTAGREAEPILKAVLSSDRSLQLDSVKLESLVIVGQHTTVNTFPGLVHTARQAMEEGSALSRDANPQGSQRLKQDL